MNKKRQIVSTSAAPSALGAYSQAVTFGDLIFCSGQIGIDPANGLLVTADTASGQSDVELQAKRALQNLQAVAEAAGSDLRSALRVTIYLKSMDDFAAVNAVYSDFFAVDPPARVTIGVSELPAGADVEIDAIISRQP